MSSKMKRNQIIRSRKKSDDILFKSNDVDMVMTNSRWKNSKEGIILSPWKVSDKCMIQRLQMMLLPRPSIIALFMFCLVFVGSALKELNIIPQTIFSNSKNPLNRIFVKWGWGWTLSLLTPYMILTGILTCNKQWCLLLKDCLRLAVGTFFWYIWVHLFLVIEHVTGACTDDEFSTKKSCISVGYKWNGFDISGHTFLLIHSILTILEELQLLHELFLYRHSTNHGNEWMTSLLPVLKPMLYIFGILLLMLCYLWVWMLFCTAVYFHTFSHKLIAAPIAIGTWFFTYHFWYLKPISPGPIRNLNFITSRVEK